MISMDDKYSAQHVALQDQTQKLLQADGIVMVTLRRDAKDDTKTQIMTSQEGLTVGEIVGIIHKLANDVNAQLAGQGLKPAFEFKVPGKGFFSSILS